MKRELRMPPTLRALLEHVIDYAGQFPPAKLPLEEAISNYLTYRASPQAWMLGGFVCPVAQLSALARLLVQHHAADGFACCVIASPIESLASAAQTLGDDLGRMREFLQSIRISAGGEPTLSLDFRLPPDWTPDSSGIPILFDEINRTATELNVPLAAVYLETPLDECVEDVAQSVDSFLWRTNGLFGLKFRTGGLEATAYPSCEALARGIGVCRDKGLNYKLTAGLHQPLRHPEAAIGTEAHGFLNVLVAAALAHAHRKLPRRDIRAILEDQSAESFLFSATSLRWRDHTATLEQIRSMRETGLASFGSCSFDEPLEGLSAMGWR